MGGSIIGLVQILFGFPNSSIQHCHGNIFMNLFFYESNNFKLMLSVKMFSFQAGVNI